MLPPASAAGRGGGDTNEAATSQRDIEFHAVIAGNNRAMQVGQARESDHRVDDLLVI
jgi:hypothetical protein